MPCSVWEMHKNVECMIKWDQLGLTPKGSKDPVVFSIIKVFIDKVGVEQVLNRNSLTQKTFLTICSLVALLTEQGSDSISIRIRMVEDNPREKLMAWMC